MNLELDQHFLMDKTILDLTIQNAKISTKDILFEIGAGSGILTKELSKTDAKMIIAIEKDKQFVKELEKIPNILFKISDGIKELKKFSFTKLIANIPYSITEPLYTQILNLEVPFAILLHGEKFYKQILDLNSKWSYFINSFYNVELLSTISGSSFKPPTKVKSVLIKLTKKKKFSKKDKFFQELFKKRKRNTKNAILFSLIDVYKLSKKNVNVKISEISFPNKKLKNLSNKEFIKLISELLKLELQLH